VRRVSIWAFIRDYIESQGQSPGDAEIADFYHLNIHEVRECLYFLARDGYIEFKEGKIKIPLPGFALAMHREIRDVPGESTAE
jgi:hypothetical protein